ncbi:MAG TPA: endonuclease/exonuclease/phosphatase family protein [Solirubrobacteraceae bacterium]|nr:endonuclease/exonuclease/phosphatase family protein [Solirubrobacteraceae bacterium]
MLVLSWNLFHGRSEPGAGRDLLDEFAAMLAGWRWDFALLQEVPPWWPEPLAAACGAEAHAALTSRNLVLPARRALARRVPDLIKSNGGGANAILARAPLGAERAVRLRTWPERRVAQLAQLEDGTVLANYHGSARVPLAEEELARLGKLVLGQATVTGGGAAVLGGDLNLRHPHVPGMEHVAARDVDHIFAAGFARSSSHVKERGALIDGREVELSDHPPLLAELG